MINFACKEFNINEIVRCSFGLTKTEYSIFVYFMKNPKYMSARTVAESLNLDLTTAQRAVKKFFEQKIVDRLQENLENGGYIFRYKIRDRDLIQKTISNNLLRWVKNIESILINWRP